MFIGLIFNYFLSPPHILSYTPVGTTISRIHALRVSSVDMYASIHRLPVSVGLSMYIRGGVNRLSVLVNLYTSIPIITGDSSLVKTNVMTTVLIFMSLMYKSHEAFKST